MKTGGSGARDTLRLSFAAWAAVGGAAQQGGAEQLIRWQQVAAATSDAAVPWAASCTSCASFAIGTTGTIGTIGTLGTIDTSAPSELAGLVLISIDYEIPISKDWLELKVYR